MGLIFLGTPFRGTHDSLSQGEILRRAQELFTESPVYGENLEILRPGGESLTDLVDMYFRIARQSTMPRVVCFYEQAAGEVGKILRKDLGKVRIRCRFACVKNVANITESVRPYDRLSW